MLTFTEKDLDRYDLDSCPRNRRGGRVDYPFAGKSVWLTPETPMSLLSAGMDLRAMETDDEAGREGFEKLCKGLSQVVYRHDLPYPQIWQAPERVEEMPSEVVFHIYQIAVTGEVPDARGNASTAGQDGDSTQPFTVMTTNG